MTLVDIFRPFSMHFSYAHVSAFTHALFSFVLGSLSIHSYCALFFLAFAMDLVIYGTSVYAYSEPYTIVQSLQQNIVLIEFAESPTTFFFVPPTEVCEKKRNWEEISTDISLEFCFYFIHTFVCLLHVRTSVLVVCCAIEFHLLSLRKGQNNSQILTTTHRKQ